MNSRRIPRRRCVGRTVTADTAVTGRRAQPGDGELGVERAERADDPRAVERADRALERPQAADLLGQLVDVGAVEEGRAEGIDVGGQLVVAGGPDLDRHGRER